MTGKCEQIQEELLFFMEGELEPRAAMDVEAHLESCEHCRERAVSVRGLNRMLMNLPRRRFEDDTFKRGSLAPMLVKTPRKTLPQGFREQVLEAIRTEKSSTPAVHRGRILRLVPAMAAAAVIIAIAVLGYNTLGPDFQKQREVHFSMDQGFYMHVLEIERPEGDGEGAR
jgi:anti-sigma factor RsiW